MSKACQLFSGSSGNSIFVSSGGVNVLVDIGVSAKRCETALRQRDIDPSSIDAVFVTHEHTDHIGGVRVFASRYGTPVFAQSDSLEEMYLSGAVNQKVSAHSANGVIDLGAIVVEPFNLSHDSIHCQGYKLNLSDGRSVSVCTDTGYVTDDAKRVVKGSDLVFLESNHEESMVETGPYTYMLKKRILSNTGHLSNRAAAEFAKELVESGTSRLVLSHLSQENNVPSLARQTMVSALMEIDAVEDSDYRLLVSPPVNEGRCIVL